MNTDQQEGSPDEEVHVQSHDMEDDSAHFGVIPALSGYAYAALVVMLMFSLATGIVY